MSDKIEEKQLTHTDYVYKVVSEYIATTPIQPLRFVRAPTLTEELRGTWEHVKEFILKCTFWRNKSSQSDVAQVKRPK